MIYDCFTFFNELDILDIRLHEMSPVVDRFVLVEATKTFQGAPKPLHFADNRARFTKFADKIIHVVVDFPNDLSWKIRAKCPNTTWAREHYQRDQIGRGLTGAKPTDLIIVSDVDEIIAADKLRDAIRIRKSSDLVVFTMPLYCFFINCRDDSAGKWRLGPRMLESKYFTTGQSVRMTKLHASRRKPGSLANRLHTRLWNRVNCGIGGAVVEIPDAGWHLSSIGTWEHFRAKIDAYSHVEVKGTAHYASPDAFLQHVRATTFIVDSSELPVFVQRHMPDHLLAA